jgi:excisionase family DNA binding protein
MANPATYEPQPLAYDVTTACRISSLGRTKLYELISSKKLESRMVGKRRLIIAESLHSLIAEGC